MSDNIYYLNGCETSKPELDNKLAVHALTGNGVTHYRYRIQEDGKVTRHYYDIIMMKEMYLEE